MLLCDSRDMETTMEQEPGSLSGLFLFFKCESSFSLQINFKALGTDCHWSLKVLFVRTVDF